MIAAMDEEKMQKRTKTEGLRGVGGPALVPDWFLDWDENKNNEVSFWLPLLNLGCGVLTPFKIRSLYF